MSTVLKVKRNDTRPSGVMTLNNPHEPDETPTPYDLTGNQGVWMNVHLSGGTVFQKAITAVAPLDAGGVRIDWVPGDWNTLVASPDQPLARGVVEHVFEIEVLDAAGERITFPNDREGYVLRIAPDIADNNP